MKKIIFIIIIFCGLSALANSNDWATDIIEYVPGNNAVLTYTNANTALGHAAKYTYADVPMTNMTSVTIINAPWLPNQIVSIGSGGKLIVKMGRQINNYDDPEHPFGVDLLVYGNSFFHYIYDEGLPQTNPWFLIVEEPIEIWVSADLTNWFMATNCFADSLMPTQSIDLNGNPANYLFPVNPALLTNDWLDGTWSYTNTVHAYGGSAGGAPVDLSQLKAADGQVTNLSFINYVKIENPQTKDASEIDAIAAVADIPEPVSIYYFLFIIYYLFLTHPALRAPLSRGELIQ